MKKIIFILSLVMFFSASKYVLANEENTNLNLETSDEIAKDVEAGNKICPVSGNEIPPVGESSEMGKPQNYEYNGKIYHLCCKMCLKDFKTDPEKYSKIADEELSKEKQL